MKTNHMQYSYRFKFVGRQVLIAVVLALLWSTNLPAVESRYHFMDLFCGEAQATKTWSPSCICKTEWPAYFCFPKVKWRIFVCIFRPEPQSWSTGDGHLVTSRDFAAQQKVSSLPVKDIMYNIYWGWCYTLLFVFFQILFAWWVHAVRLGGYRLDSQACGPTSTLLEPCTCHL